MQRERLSLWLYFLLAFGVTWGTILTLILPGGIPGQPEALSSTYPLVFVAMAVGPPLAALIVLAARPERLVSLGRALVTWQLHWLWYVVALATVPATIVVSLIAASFVAPGFGPAAFSEAGLPLIAMGVGFGLAAGFLEEIGWSGLATPALLERYGVATTGLLLGTVHGLWHLLAGFWGEGAHFGWLYLPYYVLLWIVGLIALRLLIVWLYERTQSLPIAQLTHASYTGGLFVLWPATQDPQALTWWGGGFAGLLLIVVMTITRLGSALVTKAPVAALR